MRCAARVLFKIEKIPSENEIESKKKKKEGRCRKNDKRPNLKTRAHTHMGARERREKEEIRIHSFQKIFPAIVRYVRARKYACTSDIVKSIFIASINYIFQFPPLLSVSNFRKEREKNGTSEFPIIV